MEPSKVENEELVRRGGVGIVKKVSDRFEVGANGDFADYSTYFHQILFGGR